MSEASNALCYLAELSERLSNNNNQFSQDDAITLFQYCGQLAGEIEGMRDTIKLFTEDRKNA